ncbi:unnamed protein product [Lactuca virosa]|uniref:Uncharacterized protein n=1 Tax=Lactuca virosa TaxID=75947 RepID=A0AAU9MP61_9ASTR|nr:unnamed protein product [Lactuca virosa]
MHKNRFIRGSPPRSRQIHEPIIDSIPQINKSNRCLKNHSDPCTRPPLREMRKHAVERSQCQLVDLTLVDFANHELLLYIADRSSQLRRLDIIYCFLILDAERLFVGALQEAKEGFGERDPHVASACNNLAELYRVKKAFDKAEPLYLNAISILEVATLNN